MTPTLAPSIQCIELRPRERGRAQCQELTPDITAEWGLYGELAGLDRDADVLDVVTPADWARQGMAAGSPFALAHTFAQTGPFRPANMVRGIDNVVLAGGSTVPGVGVPTTLISGRLAADRVTGEVDQTARLSRRTITSSATPGRG